jgi:hypothetical protein
MVFWFKIYVYPLFFHWSFLTIESPAERLILDFTCAEPAEAPVLISVFGLPARYLKKIRQLPEKRIHRLK